MKTYVLCAVAGFMLITPLLVAQTNATAPTPIPEEARRHFVMGETMYERHGVIPQGCPRKKWLSRVSRHGCENDHANR